MLSYLSVCCQQFLLLLLFLFTFIGLGHFTLSKCRFSFTTFYEAVFCECITGMSLVILYNTFLALTGLAYPMLICLPVLGIFGLIGYRVQWKQVYPIGLLLLLVLPFAYITLFPPTKYDEVSYHLPVTQSILLHHRLLFNPFLCRFPLFPFNAEVFFTSGMAINDFSARLVSWTCLFALALGCFSVAQKNGRILTGLLAVAMLLSSDMVIFCGVVCYADLLLALFVFASMVVFSFFIERQDKKCLLMSAALLGMGFGTKYIAIYFVMLPIIYLVCKRQWSYILQYFVAFILFGSPWCIRNVILSGNPVWPFLPNIFGLGHNIWTWRDYTIQKGGVVGAVAEQKLNENLFTLPYALNYTLLRVNLWIWPGFIAFCLMAVKLKKWFLPAAALTFILFWFFTCALDRYFLPAIPFICTLSAIALTSVLQWSKPNAKLIQLVLGVLVVLYIVPKYNFNVFPPPVTPETRSSFIIREIPEYAFINQILDNPGKTYDLYGDVAFYYGKEKIIGEWVGAARYEKVLALQAQPQKLYQFLKQFNVTQVVVEKNSFLSYGRGFSQFENASQYFHKILENDRVIFYRLAENPG